MEFLVPDFPLLELSTRVDFQASAKIAEKFPIIAPTNAISRLNHGWIAALRVWKELWLGLDSRFHLASNQTNTVNNFWTAGVYGAIGF